MRVSLIFGALLLFGCSNGPMEQFTVEFPSLTVAPGVEKTQCVVLSLHNAAEVHIGQIHNLLSDGVAPHDRLSRQRHRRAADAVRLRSPSSTRSIRPTARRS